MFISIQQTTKLTPFHVFQSLSYNLREEDKDNEKVYFRQYNFLSQCAYNGIVRIKLLKQRYQSYNKEIYIEFYIVCQKLK